MSPDPFFRLGAELGCQASDDCSTACSWSGRSGFCGARIDPECLRIDENGVVRVALSVPANDWFDALNKLGETLQLTRNAVAVLGQLGVTPRMADWRNPVLPRDNQGLFTPNLGEYASLCAVRELSPFGLTHGFESCDISGASFQRIILRASSRRDLFEQFVTDHQSPPEEASRWFSPNHASSLERCASITGRIPWLRHRFAKGARDVRPLPVSFVAQMFTTLEQARLPIWTTLYSRALINKAIWTVEAHDSVPDSMDSDLPFFYGNGVGLHLNRLAIASVWLWMGQCACCDEERWAVELADAGGCACLTIAAGSGRRESDWRNLLTSCLP